MNSMKTLVLVSLAAAVATPVLAISLQDAGKSADKGAPQPFDRPLAASADRDANYFSEDFAAGQGSWTIVRLADPDVNWTFSGGYAIHNYCPSSFFVNDWLISPAIDLTGATAPALTYADYQYFATYLDQHEIAVSTDGGLSFTTLQLVNSATNHTNWPTVSFDISAYAGQVINLGFRYQGSDADNWGIDNVVVAEAGEPVDPCEGFTPTALTLPYHGMVDVTDAEGEYFTFTLTEPAAIELNTCYEGTTIDCDSYWWYGLSCDPAAQYIGYDDGGYNSQYGSNFCGNWETAVTFDCEHLVPAGTYTVRIAGYNGLTGDVELDINFLDCSPVSADEQPVAFQLSQNVPNPFNPVTNINFSMSDAGAASLKVYDLAGREVATLVNGLLERGEHSVQFDGRGLASGVYVYTLSANGQSASQKMVLVK